MSAFGGLRPPNFSHRHLLYGGGLAPPWPAQPEPGVTESRADLSAVCFLLHHLQTSSESEQFLAAIAACSLPLDCRLAPSSVGTRVAAACKMIRCSVRVTYSCSKPTSLGEFAVPMPMFVGCFCFSFLSMFVVVACTAWPRFHRFS